MYSSDFSLKIFPHVLLHRSPLYFPWTFLYFSSIIFHIFHEQKIVLEEKKQQTKLSWLISYLIFPWHRSSFSRTLEESINESENPTRETKSFWRSSWKGCFSERVKLYKMFQEKRPRSHFSLFLFTHSLGKRLFHYPPVLKLNITGCL